MDYTVEEFRSTVKADVILDIIGGAYLAGDVKALNEGGRLVVIGMQGGRKASSTWGALLAKRGSVFATALRSGRSLKKRQSSVVYVRKPGL